MHIKVIAINVVVVFATKMVLLTTTFLHYAVIITNAEYFSRRDFSPAHITRKLSEKSTGIYIKKI